MTRQAFEAAAKPARVSRRKGFLQLFGTVVAGGALLAGVALPYSLFAAGSAEASIKWWDELPHNLGEVDIPQRTIINDSNGDYLAQVFDQNRVIVPLDKIAESMQEALIATEDSRFYEHKGLDAKGVSRAIVNNSLGGQTQGASTLTQQLVENLRILGAKDEGDLDAAKTVDTSEKLQELRFATGLEAEESKDQILETYLNVVYLGNGAYGAEAAAQRYFSVAAKDLTIDQAATLVAMLKSPTLYDPIKNPEESRLRRDVVMKRMVAEGYLPQAEYNSLIKEPTKITGKAPAQGCAVSKNPFYCQYVLNYFMEQKEFGDSREARAKNLATGGYTITTALDPKAMNAANGAVDRALAKDNRIAAGVALMEPGTGKVLAVSQNRDFGGKKGRTEIVYADTPQFQPGSTFKPITAAAALESGLPASTRINSPSPAFFAQLDEPQGGFKNDNRRGAGNIDMRGAIRASVNTYFVGLTEQVGVKDTATMARRLGMKSMPSGLSGREGSITLGSYETSPIEVATVYATLAARGVMCKPVAITKMVKTQGGKEMKIPTGDCHQEISPAVADTVSDLLQAPFTAGGTAAKLRLDGGRRAAGKTGTTNAAAATWFAGYTPQVATAVWIGDPRGGNSNPVENITAYGTFFGNVFGGTVAGPIWNDTMNAYLRGAEKRWYPKPGGVSASMTSRSVPDVTGISVDAAASILLKAGFTVSISPKVGKANPNYSVKNIVVAQSPKAGGKAAFEDPIELTLSAGSDPKIILAEDLIDLKDSTNTRKGAKK